jgi:TnpA family transposase
MPAILYDAWSLKRLQRQILREAMRIFLCNYLNSEALRREIEEGLNVIENWNSANDFIWYGKGGEIAVNNKEDQEIDVLALHLLQICIVYV